MLISYFFNRIFSLFILFFALLAGVFASCNVFLRLPFIYKLSTIPLLICVMFPLVAQFAVPLASSLAVYLAITSHKMHDELLTLSYLKKGKRALYIAVGIFSLLIGIFYALLVFQLTPQSYKMGKKLLFKIAKEHIMQLEPNKFHTPFPRFTFFFKGKKHDNTFQNLLVSFASKDNQRYVFLAREGIFAHNQLSLYSGSVSSIKKCSSHVASFHETVIDIGRFSQNKEEDEKLSHSKFMTAGQLIYAASKNSDLLVELYKRIAQVIWQLLFPMLALMFAFFFANQSLLAGLVFSGIIYLSSYVLLMLGQVYAHSILLSLGILYLPLLFILIACFFLVRLHR